MNAEELVKEINNHIQIKKSIATKKGREENENFIQNLLSRCSASGISLMKNLNGFYEILNTENSIEVPVSFVISVANIKTYNDQEDDEICPGCKENMFQSSHKEKCPLVIAKNILKNNNVGQKKYHILFEERFKETENWRPRNIDVFAYSKEEALESEIFENTNFEYRGKVVLEEKDV